MNPWWVRASRSALVLVGCFLALGPVVGCGDGEAGSESSSPGSSASDGSASDTDSGGSASATSTTIEDTESPVGWFEVGWGDGQYIPIADGDDFPIVQGGQGAQMFPMPLRGGEFYLPGNPTTWMDETAPLVDLEMDIEGYNVGPGGHFKRIANYPMDWVVLPDGTYQSSFLPIIVPDGISPEELDGEMAHLWVRLRPHEQPALVVELDVTVTVISEGPPPG